MVLVARQGFISLVSPGDVLTEWDVRGIADEDPPDQPVPESLPVDPVDVANTSKRPSTTTNRNIKSNRESQPLVDIGSNDAMNTHKEIGVKPATHQRNPADPLTLNVVAAHEGGFFVGGSRGRVLVFQQGFHGDGAGGAGGAGGGGDGGSGGVRSGGGKRKDVYTLTRVIKLFDGVADVVELRPGEGTGYRWVRTMCTMVLGAWGS